MTSQSSLPNFDLRSAFFKRQEKLRADLGVGDIATHPGTKGDDGELNWLGMFRDVLPKRYGVGKAFAIDAEGGQSEQIDVVIYDQHFSPLLFDVGGAKYIPAESIYAAFEVKQTLTKGHLEYGGEKISTVRRLRRTSVSVPHAGGVYSPVIPKRIIGGFLARRSEWNPPFGTAFADCLQGLESTSTESDDRTLDIGCAVEHGAFVVTRKRSPVVATIEDTGAEVALVYLVMKLLRKLQAVASAPAIDYDAYLSAAADTSE